MSTGLLGFESVQEWQGGVREHVSASRLSCWLKCPLAWRIRYLDGIKMPTTPSLFVGKIVHAGLQGFYRHRQLGITLGADDVAERMLHSWARLVDEEGMTFDSTDAEQAIRQQTTGLVRTYVAHTPENERPLAVEVAAEAPLVDPVTGEDLGMPLVGIIDLVLDYEEGPIIADFKTSGRSSEPMEITHQIQLSRYAYLFRQVNPRPEAGLEIRSLIKTKAPKIEFHHYPARTDAHFHRFLAVVREYLDSLDAGRFNYRPGFGCGMCDFAHTHCRRWTG